MFANKKSSPKILATLTKFNGICSWICYSKICQDIEYISATSARKLCQIEIKKNGFQKTKEQVFEWFKDTQIWYEFVYKKTRKTDGLHF